MDESRPDGVEWDISMETTNDVLSLERLRALIKGGLGCELVLLKSVGSTNDFTSGLAEKGFPHGTVVIAEEQTQGRGRLGRPWVSPPGNIYMSILLRDIADAPQLTRLVPAACASALSALTGVSVGIKWPNDLMINERKLGGILIETRAGSGGVRYAVVGIGINVNAAPEGAISLLEATGRHFHRNGLIAGVINELDNALKTSDK